MSASHAHAESHDGHDHAAHSPAGYIKIWLILCVLLAISVTGPMLEIPIVTLLTAFGIAGVKAYMVMKYFMHLDVEKPIVWYILSTAIIFICMFFAATSVDVLNHDGARWSNNAAKAAVQRGMAYGDPATHHEAHGDGHAPAGAHADGADAAGASPEAAPKH